MTAKPFLTDIQTIRKRAREHIDQGAITPGYKADRKAVIKLLNEALATEIVCVLRYKRHYYWPGVFTQKASPRNSSNTPTKNKVTPT